MGGRPRKQIVLELTHPQYMVVVKSVICSPLSGKSEATLEVAKAKLIQAHRDWEECGSSEHAPIVVRLTEGQGRAVLAALIDHGDAIGPSTGAWRKAHKKVRKALGVWEERPKP